MLAIQFFLILAYAYIVALVYPPKYARIVGLQHFMIVLAVQ